MNERLVLFFPPYKKSQFYQLMGAFFAERVYQQQFPYLVNDENCYWYVILDDEKRVTAFSYYEKGTNKVELGNFMKKIHLLNLKVSFTENVGGYHPQLPRSRDSRFY